MFRTADIVIVNKIDIAQAVGFNRELAIANIKKVALQATILKVSSRTSWQMETFYSCLKTYIDRQFITNLLTD